MIQSALHCSGWYLAKFYYAVELTMITTTSMFRREVARRLRALAAERDSLLPTCDALLLQAGKLLSLSLSLSLSRGYVFSVFPHHRILDRSRAEARQAKVHALVAEASDAMATSSMCTK